MPSRRTLTAGLAVVLSACASARARDRTGAPPSGARPLEAAGERARPGPSPTVGGPVAPPASARPAATAPSLAPGLPVAPAPVEAPAGLRPAAPAEPLPNATAHDRRATAPDSAPAARTPLPSPPPPPVVPPATPAPPRPPAAPSADAWPTTLTEFLVELGRRARAGTEPDLAPVADLLDEVIAAVPTSGAEISITRMPAIEAREKARFGRGTGWCTLTHFVEPGADASAMRASYLDIDRVHEYTGKPGASMLRREGNVTIGRTDAIRRVLAFEFGARWTFRAKSLDRGPARIVATSMEPAADTYRMLATRGVMIAFPARDGLFVAEANASLVDFEVPPLLKGSAEGIARKEMLARVTGIRTHWREYLK